MTPEQEAERLREPIPAWAAKEFRELESALDAKGCQVRALKQVCESYKKELAASEKAREEKAGLVEALRKRWEDENRKHRAARREVEGLHGRVDRAVKRQIELGAEVEAIRGAAQKLVDKSGNNAEEPRIVRVEYGLYEALAQALTPAPGGGEGASNWHEMYMAHQSNAIAENDCLIDDCEFCDVNQKARSAASSEDGEKCNAIAGTLDGLPIFCEIRRPCNRHRHDKPAPGGEGGEG